MKDDIRARIERNQAKERYVKLTNASREGAERLKKAYGMRRYLDVVEYLIEQGVKGLEASEGGTNAE